MKPPEQLMSTVNGSSPRSMPAGTPSIVLFTVNEPVLRTFRKVAVGSRTSSVTSRVWVADPSILQSGDGSVSVT